MYPVSCTHHDLQLHVLQNPGQERDDIAELEALWLSSHGQQRAFSHSHGVPATNAGKQGHIACQMKTESVETLLAAVHCVPR